MIEVEENPARHNQENTRREGPHHHIVLEHKKG